MRSGISFETMISFTLMGLFQMVKLQQQHSLTTILPLNVFQISHLYFLPSCMLSIQLLIRQRRHMTMKGILLFSLIQSLLFRPFQAKTGHILLSSIYQNASIGQYTTKRKEFYFTGFMLALGVMKRQILLPRLVFQEESQMFQFLIVILENTSMSF